MKFSGFHCSVKPSPTIRRSLNDKKRMKGSLSMSASLSWLFHFCPTKSGPLLQPRGNAWEIRVNVMEQQARTL